MPALLEPVTYQFNKAAEIEEVMAAFLDALKKGDGLHVSSEVRQETGEQIFTIADTEAQEIATVTANYNKGRLKVELQNNSSFFEQAMRHAIRGRGHHIVGAGGFRDRY